MVVIKHDDLEHGTIIKRSANNAVFSRFVAANRLLGCIRMDVADRR